MYGHLLKASEEMDEVGRPAVGVYREFTGPTEEQPLTENGRGEEPDVGVYRPFTGRQSAPDVPDTFLRPEEIVACKETQKSDEKISGVDSTFVQDQENVPDIQRAPKAESKEDL